MDQQNINQTPKKSSKITLLILILILILAGGGFYYFYSKNKNPENPEPNPKPNPAVDNNIKSVAQANNVFGLKILKDLAKNENKDKNIFISPMSLSMALTLASNGAQGETQKEMFSSLGLSNLKLSEVNTANKKEIEKLTKKEKKTELSIANSLWVDQIYEFIPDFLKIAQDSYQAEAKSLDFNNPKSKDTINDWVSENTKEKIKKIVDKTEGYSLFIINAIYFKSEWQKSFDKKLTKDQDFTTSSGKISQPLMNMTDKFKYLENNDFQLVLLPYNGEKLSMNVFLPNEKNDIDKFVQTLDQKSYDQWLAKLELKEGHLALPRFKTTYSKKMNDNLKNIGMVAAFSDTKADFSKMIKEKSGESINQFIDEVIHKTYVDNNEEGTEAAAVTEIGMKVTALPNPDKTKPFEMIVDRPFFFTISDNESGLIIFSGIIKNPASES